MTDMSVLETFRSRHPSHDDDPLIGEPVCLEDGSEIALFDARTADLPGLIVYVLHGSAGERGSTFSTTPTRFVLLAGEGDFSLGAVAIARKEIKRLRRGATLQE